jgi:hypothetical protein
MVQVYAVSEDLGKNGLAPVYMVTDGKLYRTVNHYRGWSAQPDYELRGDGRLYRTRHHFRGEGALPDYEFRQDQLIYRTRNHPEGWTDQPVFAVYD